MKIRRWTLALGLLLLFGGGTIGCESDSEASIPESSDKRMQATTQSLPSDAQMAVVFSDLATFRKGGKEAKATIDRLTSTEKMLGTETRTGFAKDFVGDASFEKMFEKKFWEERGVAPDSSFALSAVDYNQVVQTYVDDKKAFEKTLTGDGDAKTKSMKVAEEDAKKLERDGKPVVWTYDGKQVTLVYPAEEMKPENAEATPPKETLARVLKTEKKDSLHSTSGFKKFKNAAGDRPSIVYLNLKPILESQDLEGRSDRYKQFAKALRTSVDGGGLIVDTSDNKRIETRLWVGLSEKGKKRFDKTFKTSVQADFTKFATQKTLAGLRLEVDWKALWNSVEGTMPKQQKTMLEAQFKKAKESTGLDIRKDVIGNLSGQAGIFIYGIGGKASPELLAQPTRALQDLEALYVMKFGDAETLSNIADTVAGLSEDYLELRPLQVGEEGEKVESIQVLDMKMPPGGMTQLAAGQPPAESEGDEEPKPAPLRGYVHEDTLMLAASAIPEKRVRTMLTGNGEGDGPLSDAKNLDLGAKFAKTERMSGLYLNFERLRGIFSNILQSPTIPTNIRESVGKLEEGLLSTTPKEKGLFVDLTLDLVPAEETGSESSGDQGSSEGDDQGSEEEKQNE